MADRDDDGRCLSCGHIDCECGCCWPDQWLCPSCGHYAPHENKCPCDCHWAPDYLHPEDGDYEFTV